MTYYEEFGLASDASYVEIRASYKRLILLMHPDHQQDPYLRALAEVQMMRINEIAATLLNAERRYRYDESLRNEPLFVGRSGPALRDSLAQGAGPWIVVSALSLLLLALSIIAPHSEPSLQSIEPAPGASPSAPSHNSSSNRSPSSPPRRKRASSSEEPLTKSRFSDETPAPPSISVPVLGSARGGNATALVGANPIEVPLNTPRPSVLGRWVFSPQRGDPPEPEQYQAIYVELFISSLGDTLRGTYHGRYRVLDRALNPYVDFHFDGLSGLTSFAWEGDAGAKGHLTLRLESSNTLRVNWTATAMGATLSLGTGNAVLYRFQ